MDALSELISILNEEESKDFKHYLKLRNKRNDTKNIELFSILKTVDINKLKKLYGSDKNKDAYHSLRKRLYESLLLFLSKKTFEKNNSEAHEALRLLVVSKFLLEHNLHKAAFKCLKKAEMVAEKLEQYSLLHEILQIKLQYAFLNDKENLELLNDKIIKNQDIINKETRLNMAYAVLRQAFQNTQAHGKIINLNDFITEIAAKYQLQPTDFFNYKSIYQILHLANEYAHIQQNFSLIETYASKAATIIHQKSASGNQLYYHIHILYYLANFCFRNQLFTDSEKYLNQMHIQMQQQNGQYFNIFQHKWIILHSLNLHFSGNTDEALQKTTTELSNLPKKFAADDVIDLQLCECFYLVKKKDRQALKSFAKLQHSDIWYEKKMGVVWTIRKNLIEILLHAQFANFEYALTRLQSFKNRYKKYLTQVNEQRILDFVKLIEKYLLNPDIIHRQSFRDNIIFMQHQKENQDVFSLTFINWFIDLWQNQQL
ncbi:hypothetical protein MG290_07090 [Flavobacterium sp. CBA20B-1]|uniref:hypothetical protein n=1 Tax=unclassified Flavobacterium TaxID=196869 RepID=UPI0022244839|nr:MULTISPECIES: hypothetical protein [unclassified Flavobacterium]WCM43417.1 hypothetical protein MG290_07090 [Flavobacterium sp. CBA20B-1]